MDLTMTVMAAMPAAVRTRPASVAAQAFVRIDPWSVTAEATGLSAVAAPSIAAAVSAAVSAANGTALYAGHHTATKRFAAIADGTGLGSPPRGVPR